MEKLIIVNESQLKELTESGFDYVQISFPNSSFDPIFVAFKEKPTKDDYSHLISTIYNNTIENYVINHRK